MTASTRSGRTLASVLPALVVAGAVGVGFVVLAPPRAGAAAGAGAPDVHTVYLADCAVCHGADGSGTSNGPTLQGAGTASTDYELSTGRMPLDPRKGPDQRTERRPPKYPAAMQAQLVALVAGFGSGGESIPKVTPAAGDVARGGELFRLNCAACHAWAGDGGALLQREAPEVHDATPTQIAEAVRVGPGLMPAFGAAALTDDQLNSVVRYVQELDHPRDRGGQPLWHLGPVAEGLVAWAIGMVLLLVTVRWIGERG